jgi:hypothetical protein
MTPRSGSCPDNPMPSGGAASLAEVAMPAGMAWSSPFARWRGSLAEVLPSLDRAA